MKKPAIAALFVLSVLISAAVLGACSGPWNSGKGIVRINLGTPGGARSVTVTDEMKAAMVYDISLTKGAEAVEQKLEKGFTTASFTVAPGDWNITVLAYLNADDRENNTPFGKNEDGQLVTVRAGVTSPVSITMKPVENEVPSGSFTVFFDSNGGSSVESQKVTRDGKAERPDDPTREGYNFAGWYRDQELTSEYDFDTPVTADITLYARWVAAEKMRGDVTVEIEIKIDSSNTEEPPEVKYGDNGITGITVSRSGSPQTYTVTLTNAGEFTNIKWEVPGVGTGLNVTESGNSFTLDAANPNYNAPGKHVLYLEFAWNERPYMVEIPFEVEE